MHLAKYVLDYMHLAKTLTFASWLTNKTLQDLSPSFSANCARYKQPSPEQNAKLEYQIIN